MRSLQGLGEDAVTLHQQKLVGRARSAVRCLLAGGAGFCALSRSIASVSPRTERSGSSSNSCCSTPKEKKRNGKRKKKRRREKSRREIEHELDGLWLMARNTHCALWLGSSHSRTTMVKTVPPTLCGTVAGPIEVVKEAGGGERGKRQEQFGLDLLY